MPTQPDPLTQFALFVAANENLAGDVRLRAMQALGASGYFGDMPDTPARSTRRPSPDRPKRKYTKRSPKWSKAQPSTDAALAAVTDFAKTQTIQRIPTPKRRGRPPRAAVAQVALDIPSVAAVPPLVRKAAKAQ